MIDGSAILSSIFSALPWWLIPLMIIIVFLKVLFSSPKFKGKIGELLVNKTNDLKLDKNIYTNLENITLKLSDETTTQIDHLIVSKYGIFVIETKNYKGWIFGNEKQKEWTQTNYKKKNKFQNPLHQNYRHIKALQETLNELITIDINKFISIIVFAGECEFKTDMPDNVIRGIKYIDYIKSFDKEVLKEQEIKAILNKLDRKQLEKSRRTDKEHVENLNERHNRKVEI